MRLRTLVIIFAVALVGFTLARLPLSAAVGLFAPGLRAASVEGTVWQGRLRAASLNGRALGDVHLAFAGAGWRWRLDGVGMAADGLARPALGGMRLAQVRFSGDAATFAPALPVPARLEVEGGALTLKEGACADAAGQVSVQLAVPLAAPAGGDGLALTGPAACRDGVLHLALAGQASDGPVSAAVEIDPAAQGRPRLRIGEAGPDLRRLLAAAGFVQDGGALVLPP